MRDLIMEELNTVSGGDDCPPPRDTDVIDCAQSEIGNTINDISNVVQRNPVMDAGQDLVTSVLDSWFGNFPL